MNKNVLGWDKPLLLPPQNKNAIEADDHGPRSLIEQHFNT